MGHSVSSGLVAVRTPSLIWLILLHLTYLPRPLTREVITKSASSELVHARTLVKLDQMTRNDPCIRRRLRCQIPVWDMGKVPQFFSPHIPDYWGSRSWPSVISNSSHVPDMMDRSVQTAVITKPVSRVMAKHALRSLSLPAKPSFGMKLTILFYFFHKYEIDKNAVTFEEKLGPKTIFGVTFDSSFLFKKWLHFCQSHICWQNEISIGQYNLWRLQITNL